MRKTKKTLFVSLIMIVLFANPLAKVALTQEEQFPSKPIKLIVGSGPGSSSDVITRALSQAAEKSLGQPIIVQNLPGSSGLRALAALRKEKPDGYALASITGSALIAIYAENLGYSLNKDFTPIMQHCTTSRPFAVRKDAPWNTWEEFVEYARTHKGSITVGVWGSRSIAHVMAKEIQKKAGIEFVFVPFVSSGKCHGAVLGGHLTANLLTSGYIHARSGEFKPLLIFGNHRVKSFPEVPTSNELYGVGEDVSFFQILGPKGVSKQKVMKLDNALKKAMEDSNYREMTEKMDIVIQYRSSEESRKAIEKTEKDVKERMSQIISK